MGVSPGVYPCSSASKDSVQRSERILQKALSSKAISELYKQAVGEKRGISIRFAPEIQGFRAGADLRHHEIVLLSSLTDEEALSYFVFELTNFIQFPAYKALQSKMQRLEMGCEEFSKEAMRIEYQGTLLHHKVMQVAIKEMNWDSSLDFYALHAKFSFEQRWKINQFFTSANFWREFCYIKQLPHPV